MSHTEQGDKLDYIYSIGDPEMSRFRLETQDRLFRTYLCDHARKFVGDHITSILDLGCGEGQLGFALREVYPHARLVGIDIDEKSIAGARRKAAAMGLSNTEFIVGDIEQGLPAGDFDLIYASLVISYTRHPAAVVQAAYRHLPRGGYLWIKDFDPDFYDDPARQGFYGGKFAQMANLMSDTVAKLGAHPFYLAKLAEWLQPEGGSDIARYRETYPIGSQSDEGRVMLAINLGSFYNLMPAISRVQGIAAPELLNIYTELVNVAMTSKEQIAGYMANVIVRKPDETT